MLNQDKNFNINHFIKTFNSNKYYDGNVNGYDIMIMQSHEDADKLIYELKKVINSYNNLPININLEYDDNHLLDSDKKRVKTEIEKYIAHRFNKTSHQ